MYHRESGDALLTVGVVRFPNSSLGEKKEDLKAKRTWDGPEGAA